AATPPPQTARQTSASNSPSPSYRNPIRPSVHPHSHSAPWPPEAHQKTAQQRPGSPSNARFRRSSPAQPASSPQRLRLAAWPSPAPSAPHHSPHLQPLASPSPSASTHPKSHPAQISYLPAALRSCPPADPSYRSQSAQESCTCPCPDLAPRNSPSPCHHPSASPSP